MLIGISCRKRAACRCRQKHKAPGRFTRPGALMEPKGYAPDLGSEQAPQVISRKLTLGCCSLLRTVMRACRRFLSGARILLRTCGVSNVVAGVLRERLNPQSPSMKHTALLLALALCCPIAHAGPIADRFGSGVLGMQWGTSLDCVLGVLPQGDHIYGTSRGNRGYVVKDDQDFLGVARRGHNIVYWFDVSGPVMAAAPLPPRYRPRKTLSVRPV
jgi:hypothetical protein